MHVAGVLCLVDREQGGRLNIERALAEVPASEPQPRSRSSAVFTADGRPPRASGPEEAGLIGPRPCKTYASRSSAPKRLYERSLSGLDKLEAHDSYPRMAP